MLPMTAQTYFSVYGMAAEDSTGTRAASRGQLMRIFYWDGDKLVTRRVGTLESIREDALGVRFQAIDDYEVPKKVQWIKFTDLSSLTVWEGREPARKMVGERPL